MDQLNSAGCGCNGSAVAPIACCGYSAEEARAQPLAAGENRMVKGLSQERRATLGGCFAQSALKRVLDEVFETLALPCLTFQVHAVPHLT
jgi:hypothetical protein